MKLEKYALPAFVFSIPILFFLAPLLLVVNDSLIIDGSLSMDNYIKFFLSKTCLTSLRNSMVVATATVILVAPLSLLISIFSYKNEKFKQVVRIISSMPLVFSAYAFCVALIYIYGTAGFLPFLNLCSFQGILFANTVFFLPYFLIPLLSYFEELDPKLDEAAESLGSHGLHKFRKVTFPQIAHGFLSVALVTFLLVFNQISVFLALGAGNIYNLSLLMWAQYCGFQFRMATTIASVCILSTLLISIFFQPILRRVRYER